MHKSRTELSNVFFPVRRSFKNGKLIDWYDWLVDGLIDWLIDELECFLVLIFYPFWVRTWSSCCCPGRGGRRGDQELGGRADQGVLRCTAALYCTVRYDTMQKWCVIRHDTIQYDIWYDAIWYYTMWCDTIWYDILVYNMCDNNMIGYDMIWYDTIWWYIRPDIVISGMVRCDMIRCDMLYDIIRYHMIR